MSGVRVPLCPPIISFTFRLSLGPSRRSGFRLRAPAALTPAKRLKFESLTAHQFLLSFHLCPFGDAGRAIRCETAETIRCWRRSVHLSLYGKTASGGALVRSGSPAADGSGAGVFVFAADARAAH